MKKNILIFLTIFVCLCSGIPANAVTVSAGVHTRVNITYLNSSGIPAGGIPSMSDRDYADDTGKAHASIAVTGIESETVYSVWDVSLSDEEISFFFDMGFDGTGSGYGYSATHLSAGYYAEKNVNMRLSWDFDWIFDGTSDDYRTIFSGSLIGTAGISPRPLFYEKAPGHYEGEVFYNLEQGNHCSIFGSYPGQRRNIVRKYCFCV